MPFAYPVSLDVTGRRCVVVGGGPQAAERAAVLAGAGAEVVAVPSDGYHAGVLDGAFLVVVSGEDRTDRAAVFADAQARGVLCNSMDDVDHCHFAFPAVVQRGDIKVTISTGGRAPALASSLRRRLEELLPASLSDLVDVLAESRAAALPRQVPFSEWARQWRTALADVDELIALCEAGRLDEVRDRVLGALTREAS